MTTFDIEPDSMERALSQAEWRGRLSATVKQQGEALERLPGQITQSVESVRTDMHRRLDKIEAVQMDIRTEVKATNGRVTRLELEKGTFTWKGLLGIAAAVGTLCGGIGGLLAVVLH